MKRIISLKAILIVLALLGVGLPGKADSITNNFDNSLDYLANGVAGSMWDGVYLGFGDIYGGNDAGDVGYTLEANETANPGYLTVQSSQTDWAGSGDDGFFLFKVVSGDFDVSVENVEPFANPAYHMGGLLARAYTASGPHWGAPYGGSENFAFLARFQEFGLDEDIRYATNGVDMDNQFPVPGASTDTMTSRYFRITRVGDVFSFFTKTNQSDGWALHGSLTRGDLAGVPMQVGIADAAFGSSTPTTFYTDFELTGTNVVAAPALPANPVGLTATPSGNQEVFHWTPGAGSAGSILVLRKDNPLALSDKPINNYTYAANTNFGSGDDLGGGIYAVYAGAGSSVTVGGLGTTNHTYYAAVYSYAGTGALTVYGATPATTTNVGPTTYTGLSITVTPATGLPVGGAGLATLAAYDNYGTTDIVANVNATWSSSDNTILTVAADGSMNAVALGTAKIIASFSGLSATNSVSVHAPAYTDNFGTSHDFLSQGLSGSTWDGLYLSGADIPNASYTPPAADTTVFNANLSSNNVLTITAANSGWQGAQDNGPFLFKNVPGDFEASVHITDYNFGVAYEFVGLQARAYSAADNSSPSGPGYTENCVDWLRFDNYGVTSTTFNTINGAYTETDNNDGESTDYWLLMSRANGTNFYFYKKANATDPWILAQTITRPDLTNGVPLQVGLEQSMFTANVGTVQFDTFVLDAANISGGTPPSATTGLKILLDPTYTQGTLTWTPGTNSDGTTSTSFVVMRAGAPVSAQPYFGILTSANPVFGQGTDLGAGNYVVYRGVGNTATVTGLTPGVIYYAVVYGYSGSSTTKSFNITGSSQASTPPVVFTGITASLAGTIPINGLGLPVVIGQIQGGGTLDVTKSVQIISGNTNVIAATNGVITGLAVGTATNTLSLVSGNTTLTTTLVTTVRAAGYTDSFGTSHDYLVNGVTNTTWDGVYAQPGAIPGTTFTSDPLAAISDADANVTSNKVLNVTCENVGWENDQNDGFFLFKNVPGDFQASVHISYLNAADSYDGGSMVAYNNPGLLARAYNTNGSPFNVNTLNRGETWVSFTRFDLYGIGTYARKNLNNVVTQSTQPGGFNGANTTSDTNLWLLVVRQNATNFLFFQRQLATDPWAPTPNGTTYSINTFAGLPLQVGLLAGGFDSGNSVTVGFDSFMLDEVVTPPTLQASAIGGNVSISWPASGNFTLRYTSSLSPANWLPVTTPPTTANGISTVILPATNTAAFFRLAQ
jgi:hypothetical protein